ncbi:MAG: hypothetical protein ACOY3N_09370 [Bradyrhizobium sp.]|uniref:hypothetical protein n=1 Tax=Bradyrhizobium sp. TaxID=376 RepID=UPI003BF09C02
MAGLLDLLQNGGGLLDFLRANGAAAINNTPGALPTDAASYGGAPAPMSFAPRPQAQVMPADQPNALDSAPWPQGPVGAPMNANASMPRAGAPMSIAGPAPAMPAPQPAAAAPEGDNRFMLGLKGFLGNLGGGPLGALAGGLGAAITGQPTDAGSIAAQQSNLTARALIAKGADPAAVAAAARNPVLMTELIKQHFGPPRAPTTLGEGYIWNPEKGAVERAYTPGTKDVKIEAEIAARENALRARGVDPKDPKHQQYVLTGKYPREDAQPLSAADKKAIMSAEDDNAVLTGTLDTLRRAKELNSKTFTGYTAGARGWVGTALPTGGLIDPEAAKATREFNQLMSGEAIKSMSETLKGATTDREMGRFLEMLADPSTPPDIRERTIDRMLQLAERQQKINDSRINDLRGGTYYKPAAAGAEQPRLQPGQSTGMGNIVIKRID